MITHNYQNFCDNLIAENKQKNIQPKLLLHACCAPCSSSVLEQLFGAFNISVFFYNPNIQNAEEYDKRFFELQRFLNEVYPKMELIDGGYAPNIFLNNSKGLKNEKEGGKRCEACFIERLTATRELAVKSNFNYFCTTLSVSPYKNSALLNKIGQTLEVNNIKYLVSDFKKHDGYKRSIQLSSQYGLYRQNYCGCDFSKR